MPPNTERMGDPVISATVPPERKASRDPVRSLQSTAPHPEKGEEACTANPNRFSSSRPRLVEGVRVPRVSHHPDTIPIAEAPCPAGLAAGIPPRTPPGNNQWPNPPRPTEVTPTQSSAQKTPKLKSLVQRTLAMKNYCDPLYKSLDTDPREFVRYLMGNLDRKSYDAEIRCLATFYSQATVLARHVITSTITILVVANRGVHFLVPFIPRELMNSPPNPSDAEPPGAPTCSKDYQTDIRVHCVREWMYLMHLLQYWYDVGSVYTYGGPVRQESKLMLYVFYRINAMLNPYSIFIRLHEVMDNTPWLSYYQAHTQPEQRIADYESHLQVIKGLEILWNWLRNCYLVEAMVEWRHLKLYGGSLDRLPFPHSYEDQWPSNEDPFYRSRGIRLNEVEPTPENACWKLWPITIGGNQKPETAKNTNGSKITLNPRWPTSLHPCQWTGTNQWIWRVPLQPHLHLAPPPQCHPHLVLLCQHQPRRRYPSRSTIATRPQSSSGHPPTSTETRTVRTWTMRISSRKMTQPTFKSVTGHRRQCCRPQISHPCKMPQPWHHNQPPPWWPLMWLLQCPNTAPARALLQARQHTMLPLQQIEPPALAEDCQWLELRPCKLEPRWPQLHLCKSLHWQPHHTGHLDMCLPQRKHFYKGLPYHAPPGKRLTF